MNPSQTSAGNYLVVAIPQGPIRLIRRYGGMLALLVLSNYLTHRWAGTGFFAAPRAAVAPVQRLYLLDRAARHIDDTQAFETEVRRIATELAIPAGWLMAVMYAESGFNPAIANHKGSGAVGLIQFMPLAAQELGVSLGQLRQLDALGQLPYVQRYLQTVRQRYGEYRSLTDLYLGILYPRARGQDPCFVLYARPSQAYLQNAGLDENKDGTITVSDIDARMRRMFGEVYGES